MNSYIVVFETEVSEEAFREYLKSLSEWGRLTKTAYVVKTAKSASEIRDDLHDLKAPGDRIAVVKSGYVAAWSNARADNDWLKKNL